MYEAPEALSYTSCIKGAARESIRRPGELSLRENEEKSGKLVRPNIADHCAAFSAPPLLINLSCVQTAKYLPGTKLYSECL